MENHFLFVSVNHNIFVSPYEYITLADMSVMLYYFGYDVFAEKTEAALFNCLYNCRNCVGSQYFEGIHKTRRN
jgi:hypothetical protein